MHYCLPTWHEVSVCCVYRMCFMTHKLCDTRGGDVKSQDNTKFDIFTLQKQKELVVNKVKYSNLPSAMRPISHCEDLSVLHPPTCLAVEGNLAQDHSKDLVQDLNLYNINKVNF